MEHDVQLRLSLSGELPPELIRDRFVGVGLIRGEYLLRSHEEYITVAACRERVAAYLDEVCQLFDPLPVWYRTTEMTTDEVNTLHGVDVVIKEADPMKGLRGLRRGLAHPEAYVMELEVVAEVAQRRGNLHIITPFVIDADEFGRGVDLLEKVGWPNRIGSMLEIPSAVLDVERIVAAGASNVMFGFNDLSSLLTGASRATHDMKLHPALWQAVGFVRDRVPADCEWGIAGNLTPAVVERARQERVPYVSLHYCELDVHLGVDPSQLPDFGFVAQTKVKTRAQIAAARLREDLAAHGISLDS
ncbi:putative PEP-binding protein [Micromonospora sp. NPDC023644]|uniref:putative PEP-binding protein n=1 Tax=Micromonospora sp. NPDC023644 TaxID=3154321 RepID=UPI0033DA154C